MKFRQSITTLLSINLIVLFPGCGSQPNAAKTPPAEATTVTNDGFPRTVTDSFGHTLTILRRPVRIISTAPSNTEILFAVGAGPQVIGVTTLCNFPVEAGQREKIGGFVPKTISTEQIVSLQPDLVLTTGGIQQTLFESLQKLGLPALCYEAQTLKDVIRDIRLIGQATDRDNEANALAEQLEKRLERIQRRTAALPPDDHPSVFFLLSDDPLMSAGPNTFVGQMIELAGGHNVFADVHQQFPLISEEVVLQRNPTVILIPKGGHGTLLLEHVFKRRGWDLIDAVRNNRILTIDDDLLTRSGPRLFDALEKLADLLHPPANRDQK